jgi:hypothetical protein
MQITVVAIMCHALGAISQPVCREEIVVKDDMPMQACFSARTTASSEGYRPSRVQIAPASIG